METRLTLFLVATAVQILFFASRASGSAQSTAPQFIVQPINVTVYGAASIQCSALGSPQPTLSWFKDEVRVVLDSRISVDSLGYLQISSVQNTDAGDYYCMASNAVGSVRSTVGTLSIAFINSLPSPSLQRPQVANFDPLVLDCPLPSSRPNPPTVTWSPPLTTNQLAGGRVGVAQSGQLIFSYFDLTEDGTNIYECRVANEVVGSSQISSQYFVSSVGTPQLFHAVEFIITPTPSQTVVAGETVHLECFTTGSPVATISWMKDDAPLSNGGRVSITQSGRSLDISSVASADDGVYTCVAVQLSNTGSEKRRETGVVTVIVPPRITTSFPETAANISQPLLLTCMASEGTPPLEWVWLLNSEPIGLSGVAYSTTGVTSTLTINEVGVGHGGVYQCIVTQPATGRRDSANELVTAVSILPSFTHGQTLVDRLAFEGSEISFPCLAEGFPLPTFSWRRPGSTQPINIDMISRYSLSDQPGDGTLTITSALIGDSSLINCQATNDAGTITSDSVQLRVIAVPTVTSRPVPSYQPIPGETVILRCSITTSVMVTYQWTKEEEVLPETGDMLTINDFNVDDNGVYQCTAFLSVSGVGASPIPYDVGSSVITVGAPPEAPSQPLNPTSSSIMATSFIARWTTPISNGGLPLRNYSIDIQTIGSGVCPGDFTWRVAMSGLGPDTTSAMVTGLTPFTSYRFRVVTFNYEFQSPASEVQQIMTMESVPQAPPTNVQASPLDEQGEIIVSWQPPTSCTSYGGQLTTYTVEYRVQAQGVWLNRDVGGTDSAQLTLTGLNPETTYEIRVAAHTSSGQGVFSDATIATTRQALLVAPLQFTALVINSTAVSLSWEAPLSQTTNELLSYMVTFVHPDGRLITELVGGGITSTVISGLTPGVSYTFQLAAVYSHDTSPTTSSEIILPGLTTEKSFYEEVWFIAVAAAVGVLLISFVMVVVTVICFKCCCKCGSDNGKIYFSSRRSASSMSGGSSGFSEFQHKHKVMSQIVKVSNSPPPSRRSGDYADLDSLRPAPSVTAPSLGYTESVASEQANGRAGGHHPHGGHVMPSNSHIMSGNGHMMPNGGRMSNHQGFVDDPNDQMHMYPQDDLDYPLNLREGHFDNHENFDPSLQERHIRHMSSGASQQFIDTLNRVHTPPPPRAQTPDQLIFPDHPGTSQTPPNRFQGLSQETDDSWNPADNLNPRGHMTNNPVSRSNSGCSSQTTVSGRMQLSSTCSTPQKVDLGANIRRLGPLSPVHEQHLVNNRGTSHDSHMIANHDMSMQNFPQRANTVSSGNMSRSTGHIAKTDRHMSFEPHSASNLSQRQMFRHPPIGMELGHMSPTAIQQRELPAIPGHNPGLERGRSHGMEQDPMSISPVPNQHSVEYNFIPAVQLNHSEKLNQQDDSMTHYPAHGHTHRPINYYPAPPEDERINRQRYSPDQHYPPQETQETQFMQTNLPMYNHPQPSHTDQHARQHSSPPHSNYPPMSHTHTHTRQLSSPPLAGNFPPQQGSFPPQQGNFLLEEQQSASSHVYSAPLVKPKPKVRRNLQNDMPRFADTAMSKSTPNVVNGFEQLPLHARTPAVGHSQQQLLDSESATKMGVSNSVASSEDSWPLDDLQQQFETDIQDLEAMQSMLTPVVTDSRQTLEDQARAVDVNNGRPILSSNPMPVSVPYIPPKQQTAMNRNQSAPMVHPKPPVASKPFILKSNAQSTSNIIDATPSPPDPLQTSLNGSNGWAVEDPKSLAVNKLRPSIPDLTQLKRLDPRTPRIKQGKVPGSVWQPRSMNKAIQSSSESDSDSDFSIADTVVEPGDNTSLRSSHV